MRNKIKKEEKPDDFNHNDSIKDNYWINHFETNERVLPTFSEMIVGNIL